MIKHAQSTDFQKNSCVMLHLFPQCLCLQKQDAPDGKVCLVFTLQQIIYPGLVILCNSSQLDVCNLFSEFGAQNFIDIHSIPLHVIFLQTLIHLVPELGNSI